jgi:hypothetical protein
LLTEGRTPKNTPKGCKSGTAQETTKDSHDSYQIKSGFETWEEEEGIKVYYYYCQTGGSTPPVDPPVTPPASTDKCPNEKGYVDKEFQEWVWKTHLGKTETDTVTTKLCGIKNGKAKTCAYSVAVDGKCLDGTKAVWKELKDKFIEFKNQTPVVQQETEQQKIEKCKAQNLIYDATTGGCVAPVQEVDPDVQTLKDQMEIYRTLLNSFSDPTGWSQLDSLSPTKYTPNNLNIDLMDGVTKQIVELINDKGSSSDFGLFVKMLSSIKKAYNVEKYKSFFQNKVDPDGQDVFTKIDGFINSINTAANEMKGVYGYDPLTKPTEKQVREFVFRGQLRSVYKVGKINLMMMVYTYTKGEPLETPNEGDTKEIETYVNAVKTSLSFDTCKDVLGAYMDTYKEDVYTDKLLMDIKSQIQKCWCNKQYEDLGKLGVKNMFDQEMRKDRKELIMFLNKLTSANMGDFAIRLDDKVCGGIKKRK